MNGVIPYTPNYHGMVEEKVQGHTHRRYFRYVIVSNGKQLFDGYAGDIDEANQTIRAHIRLLKEQFAYRA